MFLFFLFTKAVVNFRGAGQDKVNVKFNPCRPETFYLGAGFYFGLCRREVRPLTEY